MGFIKSKTFKVISLAVILLIIIVLVYSYWSVLVQAILGIFTIGGGGFEAGRRIHRKRIKQIIQEGKRDQVETRETIKRIEDANSDNMFAVLNATYRARNSL